MLHTMSERWKWIVWLCTDKNKQPFKALILQMDRQKDRKVDTDSYKEVTPYKKNIRPIHWFENRRGHLPLPPND